MQAIPVNFNTEHKTMLSNLHMFVNKEYLAIPEKFDKLIIGLRTAYAKEYLLTKNRQVMMIDSTQVSVKRLQDQLKLSYKMYQMR